MASARNRLLKALKKAIVIIVCGLVIVMILIATYAAFLWSRAKKTQREATCIRQALRAQGFKTELTDFDITTDAPTQARENALLAYDTNPFEIRVIESLNLMPVTTNCAAPVIWQRESLQTTSSLVTWDEVRDPLVLKGNALNTACETMLDEPIRLEVDASSRSGTFISHISSLSHLCSALNVRALLELHDGHPEAAWTNLLSATRLATAWEPNGLVSFHLFRSHFITYAYATTWQALQYDHWTDAQLALLQREWESMDLFTTVPDTAAFDCAQSLEDGRTWAEQPLWHYYSFWEVAKMTAEDFHSGYSEFKDGLKLLRYSKEGIFIDEQKLLLEMTNRVAQLRRAISSPTWAEMSAMPGVIINAAFQSQYTPAGENINFHRQSAQEVLVRIAPAEVRRRILIVAIALERYRGRYGKYPATLDSLVPEFLRTMPADFMDGKPLRYHLTDNGHFVLYSVGLDCVDNGGEMQSLVSEGLPFGMAEFWYSKKNVDIVWPQPLARAQKN